MPYKILSALQMMRMFHNITYHSVKIFYLLMSPLESTTKKGGHFSQVRKYVTLVDR